MKTVLITGASSGIGYATAKLFLQKGYKVIATARKVEKLKELQRLGATTIRLDVTDENSIQEALMQITATYDKVDILVNNAGYAQNGFIEEMPLEKFRYQFEVNVFGLVRMAQIVLPGMRKAGEGLIINIGSVGGDFTSPGAGAYHASKYAVESITDAMRQELKNFGIHVSLVKPGGVETEFIDNSDFPQAIAGNPYGTMRNAFQTMLKSILKSSSSSFPILKPYEVASAVVKTAEKPQPETRVLVGRTAKLMPVMKRLLSDKTFDNMIMRQLGMLKK